MKLSVPYFSQYVDVQDESRRAQACSITCLKMVLEYYGAAAPSIDELFLEGEAIGGMTDKGWKQDAIVMLLHNHAVPAYREEFRSVNEEELEKLYNLGERKIIDSLQSSNPVFVSVFSKNGGYHLVLFIGVEINGKNIKGFYYHDPEAHTKEEGKGQFIGIEDFKKGWRRMAIFPYKI